MKGEPKSLFSVLNLFLLLFVPRHFSWPNSIFNFPPSLLPSELLAMPTGIAVKLAGALALLAMLIGAILITKFYFIDEWAEPEAMEKRTKRLAKNNCN
jgi:hypothetical protein